MKRCAAIAQRGPSAGPTARLIQPYTLLLNQVIDKFGQGYSDSFTLVKNKKGIWKMLKTLPPHEKAGRLIRLVGWISMIGFVGICVAIMLPVIAQKEAPPASSYFLLLYVLWPIALFTLGNGVKARKIWARNLGIAFGVLILLAFPIGTIIGAFILTYLIKDWQWAAAPA